jgi:hypothetical protein
LQFAKKLPRACATPISKNFVEEFVDCKIKPEAGPIVKASNFERLEA